MTLKEKIDSISCKDCNIPYCEDKCTMLSEYELNKLEQIADDYAIELLEWLTNEKSKFVILYGNQKERFATIEEDYTSKELLEIFKKEKKL